MMFGSINFEYPLQWTPQQQRTKKPTRARFGGHSISYAGDLLIDELRMLGAERCTISSNLQVRARGGGFLANQRLDDTGVVVYFDLKGSGKAMACDRWDLVEHNLWALYLSVKAIRGLERWGGSEFLDGLFTGFKALPSPDDVIISEQDYFGGCNTEEELKQRYRTLSKELHPDMLEGSNEKFNIMSKQYQRLQRGSR